MWICIDTCLIMSALCWNISTAAFIFVYNQQNRFYHIIYYQRCQIAKLISLLYRIQRQHFAFTHVFIKALQYICVSFFCPCSRIKEGKKTFLLNNTQQRQLIYQAHRVPFKVWVWETISISDQQCDNRLICMNSLVWVKVDMKAVWITLIWDLCDVVCFLRESLLLEALYTGNGEQGEEKGHFWYSSCKNYRK